MPTDTPRVRYQGVPALREIKGSARDAPSSAAAPPFTTSLRVYVRCFILISFCSSNDNAVWLFLRQV
jgi:hypothetical protein